MKLRRIFLASFVGSFTTFVLFLSLDTFWLFILKIILGIILCILAFGMKDLRYVIENIFYFYLSSIVLGGFLYFFLFTFSNTHSFSIHEMKLCYLFFVFLSPLILMQYVFLERRRKRKQHVYPVTICFKNNQILNLVAFLDTGNHLEDAITKKKIVLVSEKEIPKTWIFHPYYVPYHSLNHHGILSCIPK